MRKEKGLLAKMKDSKIKYKPTKFTVEDLEECIKDFSTQKFKLEFHGFVGFVKGNPVYQIGSGRFMAHTGQRGWELYLEGLDKKMKELLNELSR